MTRNEAIQKLQELTDGSLVNIELWAINPYVSALTFAVNILKQTESNDLISRQAAIEAIDPYTDDIYNSTAKEIKEILQRLSSVQPKQGEWEELPMQEVLGVRPSMRSYRILKCSVCRQQEFVPKKEGKRVWDYCPHCGAKMEGEAE